MKIMKNVIWITFFLPILINVSIDMFKTIVRTVYLIKIYRKDAIENAFIKYTGRLGYKTKKITNVIPKENDDLLFINSGMASFKDEFKGIKTAESKSIATSQTCIRLGGKDCDLDQVGDGTHLTSFTMLGTFDFHADDNRHSEIIKNTHTFLTEVLGLCDDRLVFTIHSKDKIGAKNFHKSTEEFTGDTVTYIKVENDNDNIWTAGDLSGYGIEIYYNPKGERTGLKDYIEICNIVRINDKVDVGFGLERLIAIKETTVDTEVGYDIFKTKWFKKISATIEKDIKLNGKVNKNTLIDHIRTIDIMVKNGVEIKSGKRKGREHILKKLTDRVLEGIEEINKKTDHAGLRFLRNRLLTGKDDTAMQKKINQATKIIEGVFKCKLPKKTSDSIERGAKLSEVRPMPKIHARYSLHYISIDLKDSLGLKDSQIDTIVKQLNK